ncbi:MAG: hypothetical protein U9N72_06675 [Bacteroidota bacterium]|nr:hypothetical protein [Bacteroidota bacterium]
MNIDSFFLTYSNGLLTAGSVSVSEAWDLEYLSYKKPDISTGTRTMTSGTGSASLYPESNDPNAITAVTCFSLKETFLAEVGRDCTFFAAVEAANFGVPAANPGFNTNITNKRTFNPDVRLFEIRLNLETLKL